MNNKENLFSEVRDIKYLQEAWSQIYENGISSSSKDTKSSVQKFKLQAHDNLYRIRRELRKGQFNFDNIKGIGVKKSKTSTPRPIVLSPPSVRIVQRSILDVLQRKPQVKKFLDNPNSFGAIKNKGVPDAIMAAINAIKNGSIYYVKSDIASFFTRIERPKVISILSELFPGENQFISLLDKATNLEIQNLTELEKKYGTEFKQLFMFENVGTPQGCCLSPLFGNILLYDFDTEMNRNGITCLRYLDDFIIFAPSLREAKGAFRKALTLLTPLGLTAYDPSENKVKASQGSTEKPFDFLGIEFHGNVIRPSSTARRKFLQSIDDLIHKSAKVNYSNVINGSKEEYSFVKTSNLIHNKVKGWGNQYFFCNDKHLWNSLDVEIDTRIRKHMDHHFAAMRKLNQQQKRRQLGIHLLIDSKSKPITW